MSLFSVLNKHILEFLGVDVLEALIKTPPSKIIEYESNRHMYCVTRPKINWLEGIQLILYVDVMSILSNIKVFRWARYGYTNGDLCNHILDEDNRISGSKINENYENNILSHCLKMKVDLENSKYMTSLVVFRQLY